MPLSLPNCPVFFRGPQRKRRSMERRLKLKMKRLTVNDFGIIADAAILIRYNQNVGPKRQHFQLTALYTRWLIRWLAFLVKNARYHSVRYFPIEILLESNQSHCCFAYGVLVDHVCLGWRWCFAVGSAGSTGQLSGSHTRLQGQCPSERHTSPSCLPDERV